MNPTIEHIGEGKYKFTQFFPRTELVTLESLNNGIKELEIQREEQMRIIDTQRDNVNRNIDFQIEQIKIVLAQM